MYLAKITLKKSFCSVVLMLSLSLCPWLTAVSLAEAAVETEAATGKSSQVVAQVKPYNVKNRLVVADPFLLQAQMDYEKADQVFAWLFRQTIKARNIGRQDWYDLVNFPGITTKADLRRVMEQSFTKDLTRQLLIKVGEQYKDIDGRLYVRSGARGDNITCGKNSYTLERVTAAKYILHVKTELLDFVDHKPVHKPVVKGFKETSFEYVRTGEGWRFATFESVR